MLCESEDEQDEEDEVEDEDEDEEEDEDEDEENGDEPDDDMPCMMCSWSEVREKNLRTLTFQIRNENG